MSTADGDPVAAPIREDGATFALTRVRSGRAPRLLALGALVAVGGFVGIGVLERAVDPGPAPAADVAIATPKSAVPATPPGHGREDPGQRFSNRPPPVGSTLPVSDVLQLDLRPAGSHLFVHGDVFSLSVTVVVVSIEDRDGHVADTRSVQVPGGSTAFRLGANNRFDTLFNVPDELMGEGLLVRASAYDARGRILAALQEPIVAPMLEPAAWTTLGLGPGGAH